MLLRPYNDFLSLFEPLFLARPTNGNQTDFTPSVDIEEKDNGYVIQADLPGVNEKDIELKVHDGTLHLYGKREISHESKNEDGYYRERRYGSFCRQFNLGSNIDSSKIEATYKNGVLTVNLPKSENSQPKLIPIHVN